MEVTGLKKGRIYRHLDSKDELAKASFSYFLITLKENYLQAIKSKETANEQFQAFASILMTLNNNDILVGGCPLMNAAIEVDDSEILIEFGQGQNEINMNVDSEQMTVFILSSMEGALALRRLYKDNDI
jgi:TetR/AcrR family transcriptional regulator, transcriptional repressor for nem operon